MAASTSLALNAQEGAELIEQGNFQKAIIVLRAVLDDLAGSIQHFSKSQQPEKINDVPAVNKAARSLLPIRSVPSFENAFPCQDHHAFAMFDRALYIEASDSDIISSVLGQNTMAVVLLYNLGLVYQLQGIQQPGKQKQSFENSMKSYQMAVAIFENSSKNNENELDGLVYMSVLNNMGHIYSHFCEGREV